MDNDSSRAKPDRIKPDLKPNAGSNEGPNAGSGSGPGVLADKTGMTQKERARVERQKRLEAGLRTNLRRRKTQMRARENPGS